MANIVQFDVDDTSPTISYFPFGDTLSTPNFTAGWNPLFNSSSFAGAPLQTGNDSSVHVTSLNGAAISVEWEGTGIRLVGSTTRASVTVLLDGQSSTSNTTDTQTLYAIDNLSNANHTVSLTTNISATNPLANASPAFVVFEKAVIRAVPSNDTSNLTFTEQPLNDNLINFRGKWNFTNGGGSTSDFRVSVTGGDTANAMFLGTSFLIRGAVSPDGAEYSITLDNTTTPGLSAKASFIRNDSVLFYASGLDSQTVHNFEIRNDDGGRLVLPVESFLSFSSGDPNPTPQPSSPPPSGNVSANSSLSSGTIAALALAGILAFMLITASLFYFLVYRPRRQKRRQLRRQRLQQTGQIGRDLDEVLDIGPGLVSPSTGRSPKSQKSNGSGFIKWKQEARGGDPSVLKNVGLLFRHSDSMKAKPRPTSPDDEDDFDDYDSRSAKSFGFTIPSTVDSQPVATGKAKGKRKPSLWSLRSKKSSNSKSSTPSYTVDLPPLSKSKSTSQNSNGRHMRSSFSEFTDITYMSTPTDQSRQLSFNDPPQTSQRPTPSPNVQERTDSHGLLVVPGSSVQGSSEGHRDSLSTGRRQPSTSTSHHGHLPEVFVEEVQSSVYSDSLGLQRHSTSVSVPGPSVTSGPATSEQAAVSRDTTDRGSVRTYDDALSVLGPATARAAIRGLSPRTSEVPSQPSTDSGPRRPEPVRQSLSSSGESVPRERLISDETVRPDASGRFLDVRASSPFHIDFNGQRRDSLDPRKSARLSGGSRVRFDEQQRPSSGSADKGNGKPGDALLKPGSSSRQSFRLTPRMQTPLTPPLSEADSSVQTSFLDFSGSSSSDPSVVSHTNDTSAPSSRRFSAFSGHPQGPRSRWSSTTAPSSTAPGQQSSSSESHHTDESHVPQPSQSSQVSQEQSQPSYHFPFPVSLPASPHHPEGYRPSPVTSPSSELPPESPPSRLRLHSHPSGLSTNPVSPAESVPISISELHFQHSDSDENGGLDSHPPSNGSHLPPHPPLPSVPPTPSRPETEAPQTQTTETVATPTTRVLFGPRSPLSPSFTRSSFSDPSTPTPHRMGPRQPPR